MVIESRTKIFEAQFGIREIGLELSDLFPQGHDLPPETVMVRPSGMCATFGRETASARSETASATCFWEAARASVILASASATGEALAASSSRLACCDLSWKSLVMPSRRIWASAARRVWLIGRRLVFDRCVEVIAGTCPYRRS